MVETAKQNEMTEEEAVTMLRQALEAAGHKIGEDGDHWPAIKATMQHILHDYEQMKMQCAGRAEMKTKLYDELEKMEQAAKELPTEGERKETMTDLKELRDIYDACFTETDDNELVFVDAEMPQHLKRATEILKALEEGKENE